MDSSYMIFNELQEICYHHHHFILPTWRQIIEHIKSNILYLKEEKLVLAGFGKARLLRGCWSGKQSHRISIWHGKLYLLYNFYLIIINKIIEEVWRHVLLIHSARCFDLVDFWHCCNDVVWSKFQRNVYCLISVWMYCEYWLSDSSLCNEYWLCGDVCVMMPVCVMSVW